MASEAEREAWLKQAIAEYNAIGKHCSAYREARIERESGLYNRRSDFSESDFQDLMGQAIAAHEEMQRLTFVRHELVDQTELPSSRWGEEQVGLMQAIATMDHMIWTDAGGWTVQAVDEAYPQAAAEPRVECADGKLRTEAEREAWLNAIWGAVKDGATC